MYKLKSWETEVNPYYELTQRRRRAAELLNLARHSLLPNLVVFYLGMAAGTYPDLKKRTIFRIMRRHEEMK